MSQTYDPLKLLRLIGSNTSMAEALSNNNPGGDGDSQLMTLLDSLKNPAPEEPPAGEDLTYIRQRLDELEDALQKRNRSIDQEVSSDVWVEDALAPQSTGTEWSPLQQELRLLAAGQSATGKFIVLNETDRARELVFECNSPVNAGAIGWSNARLTFSPMGISLQPDEQSLITLKISLENVQRDRSIDFSINVRDTDGSLLSKLWVSIIAVEASDE